MSPHVYVAATTAAAPTGLTRLVMCMGMDNPNYGFIYENVKFVGAEE
jgi:hypothetical protein